MAPSLGRNLSGNATNVTVNLVAPGTMYGDRINQLDFRVAKILKFGRSRTLVGVEIYNALNSSAVLTYNNTFVPGGTWLQPLTILTPRFFKFTAEIDFLIRTCDTDRALARSGCWLLVVRLLAWRVRSATDVAWAANSQKQVLVAVRDPTRCADRPSSANASCRSILEKALGDDLDYYSEFIDQARFADRDLPGGASAISCA